MVLEAGQRPPVARVELALEQDVADHAPLAGDRLEREEPDAGQLDAGQVAVEAAEQLVAAADGEQGRAAGDGRAERLALRGQVGRDQRLLAILPAADVEEVVAAGSIASPTPIPRPRARARATRRAAPSTAMLPRSA